MALLSDFIKSRLGLHFPQARWDDLDRHIIPAASELGFSDPGAFLHWILTTVLTQDHIEILASHLTISETYFWRESAVFDALRDHILPEIIRARQNGQRQLRFWCAACSTGEEPYSLAILLRGLIPDIKRWNITILATDINPVVLKRAKKGIYGQWSFRGTPPWLKGKYFTSVEHHKFELRDDIRRMVTFAYLNLVEDTYPSPASNTSNMDVIFCRNVLMYFTLERAQKVGQNLFQSLNIGGVLIVSASELTQNILPWSAIVSYPGAFVYRRQADYKNDSDPCTLSPGFSIDTSFEPLTVTPPIVPPLPPTDTRKPPSVSDVPAVLPRDAILTADEVAAVDRHERVMAIRTLANQGNLSQAWAECQKAISENKINPQLHYLGAVILQEQERDDEAIAALKRALYLDPNFVLVYFMLGNLSLRKGNMAAARKYFENVLALLRTYAQEDVLPESEGLTAGRLGEIIRATLQTTRLS